MSDRAFRIIFTIVYAFLATIYQPYIDALVVVFLVIGTTAAYVIASNLPPFIRAKQAEIAALREAFGEVPRHA